MDRRKNIANQILVVVLMLQFAGCFLTQTINEVFARYTSLISFFTLCTIIICYVNPIEQLFKRRNIELWIVVVASVITLVNLFVIGSNKGAFLTACDVMLAFYVAGFLELSNRQKMAIYCLGAVLLIWWYGTVKWFFNFNMVGMVFMITCILTLLLLESVGNRYMINYTRYVGVVLYITASLLCLLYHARCVLAGMIIFGVLYLVYPIVSKYKVLKWLIILLSTVGSLIFTLLYMLLARTGFDLTILYKSILSGRQDIWGELWEAFLRMPITGIGSSYKIQSFFIFEVHNGMLDILIVHGVIVFAAVAYLMIKRLRGFVDKAPRLAFAGVFAILFTSFFENFFINSPYLLVMMVLIGLRKDYE